MKLARFMVDNKIYYGEVRENLIKVIEGDPFYQYKVTEKTFSVAEVKLLAPVVPSQVICVGLNYFAHIGEFHINPQIPEAPVIFMVSPSAIINPGEAILISYPEHDTHYEAELVIVIGKKGRNIPVEQAQEYIFGYTCGNDVSDRNIQKLDKQWTRAKSFHTFKPLGPFIVRGIDPTKVCIQSRINGQVKQNSNTQEMIWNVYQLVSFLSEIMTLNPGDVIYSGTPEGVGSLTKGDICEIEIEGIGILKNPVKFNEKVKKSI
jgi:2-keto-4-pentenoate hydratase/2-oxohepta-3-ene-1,7-dioic acid hydratase in catechol pathway